ncbi:MAG: monovalent cation/H+ antiporter subunit D family protein [Hyphomicrobiales bacterium]
MMQHLPAFQVVFPLLGAVFCALMRSGSMAGAVALVVSLIMPVISGLMLITVLNTGVISYAMGGWPPPMGIEYRVDILSAFVLMLVSVMGAVLMPYARLSVAKEISARNQPYFYCMYLLCMTGLLGITITGDAFNAFVFLEISSLATYVLIALGRDRRSLLAAYQYLVIGSVGATLYVIGVGLLYSITGTLNLVDISAKLGIIENIGPALIALGFLVTGICLKLALFPLHVWLPNAYTYAPSVATIFLAGTATKVAVYLLLRFIFTVFNIDSSTGSTPLSEIFIVLSVLAMFGASIVACFQDNVKRMLAYSSVAQIGYITLGIAILNHTGLTGGIVHLFNHAITKAALFMVMGGIMYRLSSVNISSMAGLGKKMPWTMAAFVVAGLSIIGTPGTAGFISKLYLVTGAMENGWWWLGVLIVASSVLSVVYIGRVVEAAYFQEPEGNASKCTDMPMSMLIPTLVLAGACIWFGIDTHLTAGIAGQVAEFLLGGSQ